MSRCFVLIAAGALLAALPSCVSTDEYNRSRTANSALQKELDDLKGYQRNLSAENDRLRKQVDDLRATARDADAVKKQKSELEQLLEKLKNGALTIPGVEVVPTAEGIAFQVQGEVLFPSGKAEITENGKATLAKLVPTLKEQGKRLRIDGHTDTDPIKYSTWRTNLRLSAERALVVAEFLTSAGLPEDQVGVAGFGEHKPAASGENIEAKRKNRRVEILMLEKN